MHKLPSADHQAHGMFDVADLVAIGTGEAQPYLFRDALYAARNTFSEAKAAKVKINRLYYIVLRANGRDREKRDEYKCEQTLHEPKTILSWGRSRWLEPEKSSPSAAGSIQEETRRPSFDLSWRPGRHCQSAASIP